MQFVYPVYPFTKQIDEEYLKEYVLFKKYFKVALYDIENDKFYGDKEESIYRGWMLSKSQYKNLMIKTDIINLDTYLSCHYIHNWYEKLKDITFETVFDPSILPFKAVIKDAVKSLNGKFVESQEDFLKIKKELSFYRDIEVGIVCRKFQELKGQEKRFFVYKNKVFGENIPLIVLEAAKILNYYHLYTIDSVDSIIVEIGDEQVSGLKEWTEEDFLRIFH